ncbi:ribosomal protein S13 [Bradyrhizobium diazoefficiens]
MVGRSILLYMTTVRDAVARGDLDEMRGLSKTVSAILRESGEAEDADVKELKEAQQELLAAVAEKSTLKLDLSNVVLIHEGIVVVDNIELARMLKSLKGVEAEPRITITFSW